MENKPGVSVIICSYNGAWIIPRCLESLALQRVQSDIEWEVLLVDNNSTDGLASVASASWERLSPKAPLKIMQESRSGKGYALEKGFDEASYEYLIICDDDNLLDNSYVQNVYDKLKEDNSIGALGGQSTPVFEKEPPEWIWSYKENYVLGAQALQSGDVTSEREYLWGAGLALHKSLWEYLREHGFEFILSKGKGKAVGDDPELCFMIKNLGYRFFYDENLSFKHFINKERLNWNFCKHLHEVSGRANVYFEIYHQVLRTKSANKAEKINTTLSYFHILAACLFHTVLHLFLGIKNPGRHDDPRERWMLQQIRYNAFVQELIGIMFSYKKIYKRILIHVNILKLNGC